MFLRRRFAYVLEFDRRGGEWAGTKEQREWIRSEMADFIEFNNPLDLVMRKLAKVVKARGTHYVNIQFGTGYNAFANPSTIYLNYTHEPWLVANYFWHELGHVVGMNLFNPQDRSEDWAEQFKVWVYNDCPDDHPTWLALKEVVDGPT